MIYPLPAVLVSCGDTPEEYNIFTVAWTGTVCTSPPMCYISVRPERHSYDIIKRTGEFVINLTTADMVDARGVGRGQGSRGGGVARVDRVSRARDGAARIPRHVLGRGG